MAKPLNRAFLDALAGKRTGHVPVWYMRQAGRSQPEYRKLKEKYSLFEITRNPELCAYVTSLPVEQYGVDAAILYNDIMTPLQAVGVEVEIKGGFGPVIDPPVRSAEDIHKLGEIDPEEDVPFVLETIRILTGEMLNVPLIGFAGAPFTLASYMIEGGPSRNYVKTKQMMYSDETLWRRLMGKIVDVLGTFALMQVSSGARAIQVFDSWVGALASDDYVRYVQPYSRALIERIRTSSVPVIHFGTGCAGFFKELHAAGGDVMGVDWRMNIDQAWMDISYRSAVQGNLDPVALFAPLPELKAKVHEILKRTGTRPGHIFNLGHGILPETPVDNVKAVVQMVREFRP